MSAVSLLAREELRRRAGALVAFAALLALGLGATLIAFETAQRTDAAYPEYLDRADVGELVVNPSLSTEQVMPMIRSIPGVRSVVSDSLLYAGPVASVDPLVPIDAPFLQVRTSIDGRYVRQDRPVITRGRMVRSGAEAFLSEEAADVLGADVGDEVDLVFLSSREDVGIDRSAPAEPLGRHVVQVVGIGVFPDEVLPDELLPRQKLLIPHDLAAPYDCEYQVAPDLQGDDLAELVPQIIPAGCSVSYRYYSVRIDGGDRAASGVAEELARRFEEANAELPMAMRKADVGYQIIPSFRSEDRDRVAESLLPAATSLRVFGAATGAVTLALVLLLAARAFRRRSADQIVWAALGMPRRTRAVALFAPVSVAVVLGVLVAVVATWIGSPVGPIASGRSVVPHPDRSLGLDASLAALVVAALAVGGTLLVAFGATSTRPGRVDRSHRGRLLRGPGPAVGLGLGAAWRTRGSAALVAGAVLAVATVTAAVVFSTGLGRLLDSPVRYGWPFDAAVLVNAGYGPAHLDAVGKTLDRHRDVVSWEPASMTGGATVDGVTLPLLSPRRGTGGIFGRLPATVGRLPGPGEVALGSASARRLHVAVGDTVTVAMPYGRTTARVSGLVVLPAIGPLESDRLAPGVGVLIGPHVFESMLDQAGEQTGVPGPQLADDLSGFIAIDLAPEVDAAAFLRSIHDDQAGWADDPTQVHAVTGPVRPPSIVDAAALRRLPTALAAIITLGVTLAVVVGIASLTRSRRRELSILRAIGADPRTIRRTVLVQSVAVVGAGLLLGLPLGVVAGNVGFAAFERSLGVAEATIVPLPELVAIAVVALAIGVAAGFWPRRPASDGVERTQADAGLARRVLAQ